MQKNLVKEIDKEKNWPPSVSPEGESMAPCS